MRDEWIEAAKQDPFIDECRLAPLEFPRAKHGRPIHRNRHVAAHLLELPDGTGRMAAHLCDNPECVNVAHLYRATAKQNARDRVASGKNGPRQYHAST